jgi:iron complex transport system substrate-binding protein
VRIKPGVGALLAGALLIAGCSTTADQVNEADNEPVSSPATTEQPQWPIVIADAELDSLDFDASPVTTDNTILALAVGSGEVVELLGAGDQLVGRDETSATPEDVPVVTRAHQIDIEQALALEPSVVLVDELSGPPEAIDALANAGARIVEVPSVWTLADIPARVTSIADGVGADQQTAAALAQALTPQAQEADTTAPRVAFLYLRGPSAVYLLGGANTGADALIEAAGGVDVGAELGYDGFVPLTAEAIVQADPDVILVMADGLDSVGGIDGLLELPGIAQTTAGQERKVVVVDDRTLLSFGARTPALVQRLSQAFAAAG